MIQGLLGTLGSTVVWFGAIVVVLIALAIAWVAARFESPRLGLVALIPVGLGAAAAVFGLELLPPDPAYRTVLSIAIAMLGVIAGNPITVWVLGRAKTPEPAEHGGIVVASEHGDKTKREVLRGGWLIGYLERLAIVAAVVLGRFEIVAAVIAVKGLGRFSELDNAAARERFIIGTLTSIIWAGTCALLIVSANS
ncbi:MAG TPA: hypothetical protein VL294_05180 [Pseudolysinimonas sp.]|nr:hypothetical protein [Pseudolysinimonas sp.]